MQRVREEGRVEGREEAQKMGAVRRRDSRVGRSRWERTWRRSSIGRVRRSGVEAMVWVEAMGWVGGL